MDKVSIKYFTQRNSDNLLLWGIICMAVLLRVIAVLWIGEKQLTAEFDTLAGNLVTHGKYVFYSVTQSGDITTSVLQDPRYLIPSGYMPPGYPFFIAFFVWIFSSGSTTILLIEMVQVLLSAVLIYYVYQIAVMKFDKLTALIACLFFCFYPILIFYPTQITASNLYLILNVTAVYTLFKGEEEPGFKWFVIAGILFGLLILSRGQMILYVPFLAFWLYLTLNKGQLKYIAAFLLPLILILMPWSIRNYSEVGRFSPLPISSGYNLWKGNNPYATGASIKYTDAPVEHHMMPGEIKELIGDLKVDRYYEIRRDNLYKRRALDYIFNNPFEVIELSLTKFMFYWGYYWGLDYEYPGVKSPLYWLPWFLVLPLFITGVYFTIQNPKKYAVFYLYFGLSTVIVMIFFVLPRYRLLMLPFVLMFAAFGLKELLNRCIPGREYIKKIDSYLSS